MADSAALKIVVSGKVQGVMFRNFTLHHAKNLRIAGYVRNLPGGREVEIEAEGKRKNLQDLLEIIHRGPPHAVVEKVTPVWSEYSGKYRDFRIKY